MSLRTTYTVVELPLSAEAYAEIHAKLKDAGYEHTFSTNGMIDMTHIGVTKEPCPCALDTCELPWEPGCGLGSSVEHAKVVPEPVQLIAQRAPWRATCDRVLIDVVIERAAQEAKWGEQNHPSFSAVERTAYAKQIATMSADAAKGECDRLHSEGQGSYHLILREEFLEAAAERDDPVKLRTELIQAAAVAVAWVECIDRREARRQQVADVVTSELIAAGDPGPSATLAEVAAYIAEGIKSGEIGADPGIEVGATEHKRPSAEWTQAYNEVTKIPLNDIVGDLYEAIRKRADEIKAENAEKPCWCHACKSPALHYMALILCPVCGNKRCPRASDHNHACTHSNEPGQPGSIYRAREHDERGFEPQ